MFLPNKTKEVGSTCTVTNLHTLHRHTSYVWKLYKAQANIIVGAQLVYKLLTIEK